MKSEQLLHVAVEVAPGWEEPVGAVLEKAFDAPAVIYHDLEAGRNLVSVYVPAVGLDRAVARADLARRLTLLNGGGRGTARTRITFRRLKPTDWAESWKRHFKPIEIPGKLLIKPSWSRRSPKGATQLVILDPGLSFGTGQHPTTRFCLEHLAGARNAGTSQSFLDIGTGTGILAIAAAKLGYRKVHAFDFDPVAVRIARENAAANQTRGLRLTLQDLTQLPKRGTERFDIICANLTHDLLVGERDRIVNRLRPGGSLLLAGILSSQFKTVEAAYNDAGLGCCVRDTATEWTSGVFRFDENRPRA